jgi:SPP1 gp7 family putative phage head morphogenesis protein
VPDAPGQAPAAGTSYQVLGGLRQAATGAEAFTGLATQHLGGLVQAAAGGELFAGSVVQHLAGLVQAAAGAIVYSGPTAQHLAGLRQAATGATAYIGTATQVLGGLVQSSVGYIYIGGGAAQRLGGLTQAAHGYLYIGGAAGQQLAGFVQAAVGRFYGGHGGYFEGPAAQRIGQLNSRSATVYWPAGAPAGSDEPFTNPSHERERERRRRLAKAATKASTPRADAKPRRKPTHAHPMAAPAVVPLPLAPPPKPALTHGYARQGLAGLAQGVAGHAVPPLFAGAAAGAVAALGQAAAGEHVPHIGPCLQALGGLGQQAAGTHALQALVAELQLSMATMQAEHEALALAHADTLDALAAASHPVLRLVQPPEPLHQDPAHPVPGGYQWGTTGKVYKSKAKAQAQARAIYATGWRDDQLRAKAQHLKASQRAEARYVADLVAIQGALHKAVLHIVHRELGAAPASPTERHDAPGTGEAKRRVIRLQGQTAEWVRGKVKEAYNRMATEVHRTTATGTKLLGIHVGEVPALQRAIDQARSENVALITNASRTYLSQVRQVLEDYEGMPAGEAVGAKRLAALRAGAEPETVTEALQLRGTVSASRAQLIARDQTLKLSADLTRTRQQAAGVTKYVWNTSQDERVRPGHRELHGKVFSYDDPPDTGDGELNNPGEDFQCFPSSTEVECAHGVTEAFRRWYDGELTSLVLVTGKTLRATPHHPVLTRRGWVPIGALQLTDDVVQVAEDDIGPACEHKHDRVPAISEVFAALEVDGVLCPRRSANADFHGDGTEGDVDVVLAARPLSFGHLASSSKRRKQFTLAGTNAAPLGGGTIGEVLCSACGATDRSMSGIGQSLSLAGAHAGHAQQVGLGAASDMHTGSPQPGCEHHAVKAGALGDGEQALAGLVCGNDGGHIHDEHGPHGAHSPVGAHADSAEFLAQVVGIDAKQRGNLLQGLAGVQQFARVCSIDRLQFHGWVYNLSTAVGWYAAGGIVAHNCRCVAVPVIDELDGEQPEAEEA